MIHIKIYYSCRYMGVISLLSIFVLTTSIVSCNRDEDLSKKYEILTTKDGRKLEVRVDTCIYLSGIDSIIPNKPSNNIDIEYLNRFIDCTESRYWIKTKLGDWCTKYGLSSDSIYLSKKSIYSQYIPEKKGYIAIPFISTRNQMGFINTAPKYIIGFHGGYGITPIKGVYGNCWTVIFNIKYDNKGNEINVYYPCNPEQLKWYYYWYKL